MSDPPSRILRRGRHRRLRAGLALAAREAVSKCVNERISIGRGRLESDNEQLLTDNRERCSWACAKSEDCLFPSCANLKLKVVQEQLLDVSCRIKSQMQCSRMLRLAKTFGVRS